MNGGRLSMAARAYIVGLSAVAVAVGIALVRTSGSGALVGTFIVLTGLGMLTHAFPVQGLRHQAYQVTLPFIVIAAAMFSAAQLVAFIILIHLAEQARVRRRPSIQWFNVCNYLISAAIAALLFHRAAQLLLPDGALGQLIDATAAASVFILVNRVLLTGVLWLARGLSPLASGLFQPEMLAADLVIAWIAGPMLVVAVAAGTWTVLFTAGPLLFARTALTSLIRRRQESPSRTQARAA